MASFQPTIENVQDPNDGPFEDQRRRADTIIEDLQDDQIHLPDEFPLQSLPFSITKCQKTLGLSVDSVDSGMCDLLDVRRRGLGIHDLGLGHDRRRVAVIVIGLVGKDSLRVCPSHLLLWSTGPPLPYLCVGPE